jgi:hypothetical protein
MTAERLEVIMGFDEDRQARAREAYARRMKAEEERKKREEEQRRREEAAQRAEEQRRQAQQRAEEHRREMEQQKQQREAQKKSVQQQNTATVQKPANPWDKTWNTPKVTVSGNTKSANTFYTNDQNSGTMTPRFASIAGFKAAIGEGQNNLNAMHHQQFLLMLKNDVAGMAALDEPIKQAEKDLDSLKIGMGEVMGANVHGKAGNQLLGNDRPLFAANDTKAHVTGLDDKADSLFGYKPEDYKEPADSLFGKRPQDYEGKKGVTNSGGGYADFFREQREGVTDSGGGYADFFRWQREGDTETGSNADFFRGQRKEDQIDKLKKSIKEIYPNMIGLSNEDFINKYEQQGIHTKQEASKKLSELSDKLSGLIGTDAVIDYMIEIGSPTFQEKKGPTWSQKHDLPPLEEAKGTAFINGNMLPVVTWEEGYEEMTDKVKETVSISADILDPWKMISNMGTVGEKDSSVTEKYTSPQGGVSAGMAGLGIVGSMLNTNRHFDLEVKTLGIEGKDSAVIEYNDNWNNVLNIFGTGPSSMTKKQAASETSTDFLVDNDYQYIDEKHQENPVTGYLYVQDGKVMVQPIIYPKDKIVRDGNDITYRYFHSYEVDKGAVKLIDKKLKEKGIDLGIDLRLYE